MSNQLKLQKETFKGLRRLAKEASKSTPDKTRENNEQGLNGSFDDAAEMFRGLITGDEHYHSRNSSSFGLW